MWNLVSSIKKLNHVLNKHWSNNAAVYSLTIDKYLLISISIFYMLKEIIEPTE